jgi:hypothetical protein
MSIVACLFQRVTHQELGEIHDHVRRRVILRQAFARPSLRREALLASLPFEQVDEKSDLRRLSAADVLPHDPPIDAPRARVVRA